MSDVVSEQELRDYCPEVPWEEPLEAAVVGTRDEPQPFRAYRLCRICIAQHGLKGWEIPKLHFKTREDFDEHFRNKHALFYEFD